MHVFLCFVMPVETSTLSNVIEEKRTTFTVYDIPLKFRNHVVFFELGSNSTFIASRIHLPYRQRFQINLERAVCAG